MANITKITLPNGSTYDIVDASALHDASAFDAAGSAASAQSAAESYADGLISGLGAYLTFKGTKPNPAAIQAVENPKVGWVYAATNDNSEWVCVAEPESGSTLGTWEMLGKAYDAASNTHVHDVVIDPATKTTIYSMTSEGTVVPGSPASIGSGFYTPGSVNTPTAVVDSTWSFTVSNDTLTISGNNGSHTNGVAAVLPSIDITKFNGGSATSVTLPTRTAVNDVWYGSSKTVSSGGPHEP